MLPLAKLHSKSHLLSKRFQSVEAEGNLFCVWVLTIYLASKLPSNTTRVVGWIMGDFCGVAGGQNHDPLKQWKLLDSNKFTSTYDQLDQLIYQHKNRSEQTKTSAACWFKGMSLDSKECSRSNLLRLLGSWWMCRGKMSNSSHGSGLFWKPMNYLTSGTLASPTAFHLSAVR